MLTKCVSSDTGIIHVNLCPPATVYALQTHLFLKQSTVVFSVSQNDSFIIKVIHHQKLRAGLSYTQILVIDQFVKLSLVLIMTVHVFTVYSQE